METAVVWFRDDLRVDDNPTLCEALEAAERVVPLYVYDPRRRGETRYGTDKLAPHRARFRRESLADLRTTLRNLSGELFLREGPVENVVPAVVSAVDADAVFAQRQPAPEERGAAAAVDAALPGGVDLRQHWTHTLYHVDDLPTPPDSIDDTFTPWRTEVERHGTVREPRARPERVPVPDLADGPGEVLDLAALGVDQPSDDDRAVLRFEGGETVGKHRVQKYIWEGDHLQEYKQTRNGLIGAEYSSKFSPWLAAGCLSPRWIDRERRRYEAERVENDSTYWLAFELLWRDFFQFQFRKHGARFFHAEGIRDVDASWEHDREAFDRWAAGETGVPFVDANMRELNQTGYMSNRGRQNVASFLTDVLGVDWRWGAAYFEARLVDYDVASNWGNWAYQAGVGNDSRDRYFNVLSQAGRYDGDAAYVTTWLPELADLPPEYAHRPWRLTDHQQATNDVHLGVDYPPPMVDIEARYSELSG